MISQEKIDEILCSYGLKKMPLQYYGNNVISHYYTVISPLFGEDQTSSGRGEVLEYYDVTFANGQSKRNIRIYNKLGKEFGKYYLISWNDDFSTTYNENGQDWYDILTEEKIKSIIEKIIYDIKSEEQLIKLERLKGDF